MSDPNIGKFVVISPDVGGFGALRTICNTVEAGITHAFNLFGKPRTHVDSFYVVQIVKKVLLTRAARINHGNNVIEDRAVNHPPCQIWSIPAPTWGASEAYDPATECHCTQKGFPHECAPRCGGVPSDAILGYAKDCGGSVRGYQWKRGRYYYWISEGSLRGAARSRVALYIRKRLKPYIV